MSHWTVRAREDQNLRGSGVSSVIPSFSGQRSTASYAYRGADTEPEPRQIAAAVRAEVMRRNPRLAAKVLAKQQREGTATP